MKVKKNKIFEFPVAAIANNFIVTNDGEVWAGYHLSKQGYPLNDSEFFRGYIADGEGMLSNDQYEYHLCNIPQKFPLDKHIDRTIKRLVKGKNADLGAYYFNEAKDILQEEVEEVEYETYLFIKFSTIRQVHDPLEYIELFHEAGERKLNEIMGVTYTPTKILSNYVREEKQIYSDLLNFKHVNRISDKRIARLFYYFYHRANPELVNRPLQPYELNEGILESSDEGYVKIKQTDRTHYNAFFCMTDLPASNKGSAFIQNLEDSLQFPLETHVRIRFEHPKSDQRKVNKMRKRIFQQDMEQQSTYGVLDEDEVILFGQERLNDLQQQLKGKEKRLCHTTITFVISADSEKQLKQRISDLKFVLEGTDYKIYQPVSDQMVLFNQCLLGSSYRLRSYEQVVTTGYLADMGFDLNKEIGNRYGLPLGRVITAKKYRDVRQALDFSSRLVWFFPSLAKRNIKGSVHKNGNTIITGPQGQGKSVLVKYLFLWLTFLGQKILYVDPKNETELFFRKAIEKYGLNSEFRELYERIHFVSLSTEERYRGMLDPLLFLPREEAIPLARSVLEAFGEVESDPQTMSDKKTTIITAIETVMRGRGKKHLTKVIEEIRKNDPKLAKLIASYHTGLGKILLGNDLSVSISFDTQINVLGLQGLQLPTKKAQENKRMNSEQIASMSIMEVVMKLSYVFSIDKSEDAAIIFDEAKGFEDTEQGSFLIEDSLRKGRANKTDVYIVTQSFSDYDDEAKKELLSYKFAFRPRQKDAQRKVLSFFGMEDNTANMEMIGSLMAGTCLFQDHLGRNQPIAIDILFDSWLAAISSTDQEDAETQAALALEEEEE
ncbi:ATP-binding protein [Enterococcus faecium]